MVYGLIGKSLLHSYSKEIHEALGRYSYELFSLSPGEMEDFVRSRDFAGLNITIPYKKDVIPLCDHVTDLAGEIGAVNTLYWENYEGEKRLTGHNTDYEGFLYAASRAGIDFKDKTVLILGTGGTSLMAGKAASRRGAKRIYTASRSGREGTVSYESLPDLGSSVDILVNATPVGTFPDNLKKPLSLKDLPGCEAVIDVIYNPGKTALLLEAEERGIKFSNGLPMLVAQATAAAGYFLGTPGAFESENERIIALLEEQMENIVIIGMPGSGKTTAGRLLSQKTGRSFFDIDREVEREAGITVPEIFEREGEEGFRRRESKAAADLGKRHGIIIAAGGGTVLRRENLLALRQNGRILHLKRPVESLAMDGRPLSSDREALKEMEKKRLPVYEAAADLEFDNSRPMSKKQLAEALLKTLDVSQPPLGRKRP